MKKEWVKVECCSSQVVERYQSIQNELLPIALTHIKYFYLFNTIPLYCIHGSKLHNQVFLIQQEKHINVPQNSYQTPFISHSILQCYIQTKYSLPNLHLLFPNRFRYLLQPICHNQTHSVFLLFTHLQPNSNINLSTQIFTHHSFSSFLGNVDHLATLLVPHRKECQIVYHQHHQCQA